MAQPVTVYRWDDPGAPQRSPSNAQQILNILKKCLVEGYGTKDPLGWTLEYEDPTDGVAVFRNSPVNGSGGVFRFTTQSGLTGPYIRTQSAQAATGTSFADLFNPGYLNTIGTDPSFTRWILVGNKKSFYFILHHASQNFNSSIPEVCFFCGDIDSLTPEDASKFICTGFNSNSTTSAPTIGTMNSGVVGPLSFYSDTTNNLNATFSGDASRSRILFPTSVDGSALSSAYSIYVPGLPGTGTPNSIVSNTSWPAGSIIEYLYIKREVSLTAETMFATDRPLIRGRMPGIMTPKLRGFHAETWPVIKEIDGVNYLGVSIISSSSTHGGIIFWINLEDWG
ncbi:hypothetical protein H1D31_00020 [Alishewanella sp. BS5-314]|uniref:hypothetical protein n=1 Tax=Alishewanella sp. BS5-314 TaxID=2755587 RepID=UPI0021BAC377|nr:hypothetical protein [Alishewanella sp. BS5-314]MCT8124422.1 hypothetical protein [Alishewanella sp. BS5-314]